MRRPPLDEAPLGRMLARGLVARCPRCGSGHLFSSWFRLRERCPGCGMRFEREEGFWLGGYVINFALGEAGIFVLLAVLIGLEANGGGVNVALFVAIGVGIAILGPVITYPMSRTSWSAIDMAMRPLTPDEKVAARAEVARAALTVDPADPPPRRRRQHRAGL